MHNDEDICEVEDCERDFQLTYRDDNDMRRRVCMNHWNQFCDKEIDLKDTTVYKKRTRARK